MAIKVYLSGAMGGRQGSDVLFERRAATDLLRYSGIEVYDPAQSEKIEPEAVISLRMDYTQMKSFVTKDDYNLAQCDVYLCLTGDTPSDGTWDEKCQAQYIHKIPTVLVAPKRCSGELMGYANIKADALFPTISEACNFIIQNYGGR